MTASSPWAQEPITDLPSTWHEANIKAYSALSRRFLHPTKRWPRLLAQTEDEPRQGNGAAWDGMLRCTPQLRPSSDGTRPRCEAEGMHPVPPSSLGSESLRTGLSSHSFFSLKWKKNRHIGVSGCLEIGGIGTAWPSSPAL